MKYHSRFREEHAVFANPIAKVYGAIHYLSQRSDRLERVLDIHGHELYLDDSPEKDDALENLILAANRLADAIKIFHAIDPKHFPADE